MAKLPTVRRLAASIYNVGKKAIWLDPTSTKLSTASSREDVRKLIKEGFITKRRPRVHSKYHARKLAIEKSKGRHLGVGKVRGSKNARFPEKTRWILKIRELRSNLKTMRQSGEITPTLHKILYRQCKGNLFKNINSLKEHINKLKENERRQVMLDEQAMALKME
ncbi:60S ribosomal protein L19 [Pseudoloma neurophilia]|uniref:60S ribosomal protein L19 n=1 Tax=Pseudoloma neurophilia TaxID=146866 RepID=A0A0R0M222_9MICR|nr:60S ribosomal protein L19 [Pseudoloma neurophilia]